MEIPAEISNKNNVLAAVLYGMAAILFYGWIVRSAKEVASPLAVWVNESNDVILSEAA